MSSAKSISWLKPLVLAASMIGLSCGSSGPENVAGVESQPLNTLTIRVEGPLGEEITDYRWVLERDDTYHVVPGAPDPATQAVRFHQSYMQVADSGDSAAMPSVLEPTEHYFLSVLPDAGYSIGGAAIAPDQTEVTIVVNEHPVPTAQITVQVFHDNEPINNAIDLPAEQGLAGFTIVLDEPGGRYGQAGGVVSKDAFDNPLGTTYNPDGSVAMLGDSMILTDAAGLATIKNLSPGKYGVRAVPPLGSDWVQTATIEGSKTIDAWVKPNEPAYFMEFGPPGYHVVIGFVEPMNDTTVLTGGSTITGQVTNLHMSKPPGPFFSGAPLAHTNAWVGLNVGAGAGRGVYAQPAAADGSFSIPAVPPGDYQLVVWDSALDLIFALYGLTVAPDGSCSTPSGSCALGDVPVFQWFTRQEHHVFYDADGDGFRDESEVSMPDQNVNLRWRDGTIYQAYPTDMDGFVPFDQIFPFFAWQVAEIDFARHKATGVTITVDDGGPVDPNDPWSFGGQLTPQPQPDNAGLPYRTEVGPVLTQAFQGFIGQTSVFQWGKQAYGPGENGGISGIVFYATTRAEDSPQYAAAEPWEPGIPRVTVNLYDETGTTLLDSVTTDSWDDAPPTGCAGEPYVFRGETTDCFDGLKNFNQVRPGVFDGGYAFNGLSPGKYVVEVVPPVGYEIVKEEDRNVDFGDAYTPSPMLLPVPCVGPDHEVPLEFTTFPLFDENGDPVAPHNAGNMTPLCTKKLVTLYDRQNAAADFFLFTPVPIAAHVTGFVLDDLANEFDPFAPTFGEKYAPPWLPISFRDWTGREIARTYSDEFGVYNALLPSTFTADRPMPSGMAPNMVTACVNSPTKPDPAAPGGYVLDPFYNPQYSEFCYTMQFMPGTTTYLDTPVVPTAAFAGPNQFPLDCELPSGTPRISAVRQLGDEAYLGPYVPIANDTRSIEILAPPSELDDGWVTVPDPAYDGTNGKTTKRDYGFGAEGGTVLVGALPLTVTSWTATRIVARVPSGITTGELKVTRNDTDASSVNAVTLTVGPDGPVQQLAAGQTIQAAIDAAPAGTLLLVPPGVYDELVVLWKPIRLQGAGESTIINALKVPAEKLVAWRALVDLRIASGDVDLLPAQEIGGGGAEPDTLATEQGPAVLVLAKDAAVRRGGFGLVRGRPNARVDGFTLTGSDDGGAIVVNGYGHYFEASNNLIVGNFGPFGGGVRVGHPALVLEQAGGLVYQDAANDNVWIHDNQISRNGALGGAGGGISLYNGSRDYTVERNFICGNFTQGDGGGIGHLGLSTRGLIQDNRIVFNESFNQTTTVSGGGISISGLPPLAGDTLTPGAGTVRLTDNVIQGNSASAGDGGGVRLHRINGQDVEASLAPGQWYFVNLINNAIVNNVAALAGGGISLQDATRVRILHDVIYHNDSVATAGAAFAPGSPGQSTPQPAGIVSRAHSPELRALFPLSAPAFSDPDLVNSVVRHNRSFYFKLDDLLFPTTGYGLLPDLSVQGTEPVYYDLAVTGAPGQLRPLDCILTDTAGYDASNLSVDPAFVAEYPNGSRSQTILLAEATTAIAVPAAFDEGGNWVRVSFGPLTLNDTATGLPLSDVHVQSGSPAIDAGRTLSTPVELLLDVDGEPRPAPGTPLFDIGLDEVLLTIQ